MSKTTTILYVDVGLLTVLTEAAHTRRMSRNALIVELLTAGVGASVTVDNSSKPLVKVSRNEELVYASMKRLQEQNDARERDELEYRNVFYTLKQIARAAGLYPSVVLQALRRLEYSGSVRCAEQRSLVSDPGVVEPPVVEHWHRTDAVGVNVK